MKKSGIIAVTFLSVWITGLHVSAQQARERSRGGDDRDGDRVCFFMHVQFEGPSWCYLPGDEMADLRERRNEVSSVRVFGRARVVVYDLREFTGASDEFDMDVPDLTLRNMERTRSWNDRIDSFQVVYGFGGRGNRGRDDRDFRDYGPSRDRICVYDEANYRGRSQCWDVGQFERNLSRTNGWNDQISSVRVFGRARVDLYRDADYRGERLRINRDLSDLTTMPYWNDQISSFEVR